MVNTYSLKPIKDLIANDLFLIDLLAIIVMFFFISMAVPYGFPLTPILILTLLGFFIFFRHKQLKNVTRKLVQVLSSNKIYLGSYILLLLIFLVHSLPEYGSNPLVTSTLRRAIFFHAFALIFFIEINRENMSIFLDKFTRYTAISVAMISIFSLIRLFLCFKGIVIETDNMGSEWMYFLSSLTVENNFYALGIISGLFSILYQIKQGKDFSKVMFGIILLNIYFTASRRAFLVLAFLFLYYLSLQIKVLIQSKDLRIAFKNILLPIFLIIAWVYVPSNVQKLFSGKTKEYLFTQAGFDFVYSRNYLPLARHRYYTILFSNADIEKMRLEYLEGDDYFEYFRNLHLKGIPEGLGPKRTRIKLDLDFDQGGFSPSDGGRIEKFKYTFELFSSRNLIKKFLGDGFNYHRLFYKKFVKEKFEYFVADYPHQPFLTILLSGGIISIILFSIFYFPTIYYSIKLMPNFITIGLFLTVHFYNNISLDIIWSNYHFPFVIIFGFKIIEIYKNQSRTSDFSSSVG
ncbi:MAG: hypothetical protein CME62_08820 [Halobacteriovoraceae bacterium]|nr:hypothetical protein [Halobacteriovoraceae bacterium]|tara:strand:- start:11510 stop:13060 length:1551 start_codon:yes stop_codon:yes gene_type:complete